MDVDNLNFKALLPSILTSISRSRFVALDLELSGIPSKSTKKPQDQALDTSGKQSLQQRYLETKAAAERFHVLQLGLTCVEEDGERGVYVMKPYNFNLSPLVEKRLKIEREFTYQGGGKLIMSVDFLLSHNYRMDAPFLLGIPFLSWEEEARARQIALAGSGRDAYPDIGIRPDDVANLQLMNQVREDIAKWKMRDAEDPQYLNIVPAGHGNPDFMERGLNGYQKRLVHQLIRAEYPELVSVPRFDFIQLIPYDKEREEAQVRKKTQGLDRNLEQQAGIRWIVEALCSNVEKILPEELVSPIPSATVFGGIMAEDEYISTTINYKAEQNLRQDFLVQPTEGTRSEYDEECAREVLNYLGKGTVLVGHNLFLDLVYLFACFFGPLPKRVEDFQSTMAALFPLILDTKYVADIINQNSPRYRSSLEEIDTELSKLPSPVIEIPPEHMKYGGTSPYHEAGFDSFLTARVLTRLAAKIDGQSILVAKPKQEAVVSEVAPSTNGETTMDALPPISGKTLDHPSTNQSFTAQHLNETIVPLSDLNVFGALALEEPKPELSPELEPRLMMPSSEAQFWSTYGSKLRVNGTLEEVCIVITEESRPPSDDSLNGVRAP